MSCPKISVIIPTRNRARELKRILDSLLEDDYPNKEIIVCDAASNDGTVDLLTSYGAQVLWVSEPDKGEFDARNKAVRMSNGDIIRNLSDDEVHVPGSLGLAAQFFAEHPQTDLLFGQALIFHERLDGRIELLDGRKRTADSITLRNFLCGFAPLPVSETVFFRRQVFDQIGPFDNVRGGDYEYWARAAKNGLKIDISEHVFVHYFRSERNEVENAWAYKDLIRAQAMLADRYGSWVDRLYINAFRIPSRLAVLEIYDRLPRDIVYEIRRIRWRRVNARKRAMVSKGPVCL